MKKRKIKKLVKEEVIKVLKKRESKGDTGAPKANKGSGKGKLHSKKGKDKPLQEEKK